MKNKETEELSLDSVLNLDDEVEAPEKYNAAEITAAVRALKGDYARARSSRDTVMRVCLTLYHASLDAYTSLAEDAPNIIGNVKKDWRHKLHGPYAFENVETAVGYLMAATFPTENFFTLEPTKTEDIFRAKVATALVQKKLTEAKVKQVWEDMFRQTAILGFSTLSMSWEKIEGKRNFRVKTVTQKVSASTGDVVKQVSFEPSSEDYCITDNLKLTVEDPTHIFLDPLASDPNEGNVIRIVPMKMKEIVGKMKAGTFNEYPISKIKKVAKEFDGELNDPLFREIQGYGSFNVADQAINGDLPVLDFYGDLLLDDDLLVDYHIVILGDLLLVCEPNPAWAGRPFITTNYTRVQGRPYGVGIIEPNIGFYILLDVIQNQRLDAFELALNGGMLKVKQQCPEQDFTIEPGRAFDVIDADDITLLELPLDNVRVAREEIAAILEQIKRSGGTADYVGAGPGRDAERVTATEVGAVRDAGGNRLRLVRESIQDSAFIPFLHKAFMFYTQCTDKESLVRVLGESELGRMLQQSQEANDDTQMITTGNDPNPPEYLFVKAGPEELAGVFEVHAKGSEYILNKAERFNELVAFSKMAADNQMFAAHVDAYQNLLLLADHSGVDGWERAIKKGAGIEGMKAMQAALAPQPPAAPPQGPPPSIGSPEMLGGSSNAAAGIPEAVATNAASGGMEAALQNLSGQGPQSQPTA